MHENHMLLNRVPAGHPGERRPMGLREDREAHPIRRAAAEAELLRARLRQGESHAGNLRALLPELS
jgi:hypothetical protein